MFVRNIRGLYRQTALGLFWAFLPPLANTAVWLILRQAGAIDLWPSDSQTDPGTPPGTSGNLAVSYAVYVVTGMVIWQSFVEAFQLPLQTVNANRNMLGKLRFPRESLLLTGILEIFFNFAVRMIVLIPLLVLAGPGWTVGMLASPLLVLGLVALGLGLGLLVMPPGMLYHDIGKLIAVAVPVWMIITPIVYGTPDNWDSNPLNWLNPASPLLTLTRDLLVFGTSGIGTSAIVWAILAVPLLLAGLLCYRLAIPVLVERITG
jgi:lipopolysaccharide transport system permease protein